MNWFSIRHAFNLQDHYIVRAFYSLPRLTQIFHLLHDI